MCTLSGMDVTCVGGVVTGDEKRCSRALIMKLSLTQHDVLIMDVFDLWPMRPR
jgi:hypothetical protein